MNPPPHIRLAHTAPEPAREDGWQLDLPQDPAAAADYLRAMERSRQIELDAIRRLRGRIEGDAPSESSRVRIVAATILAIAVLAAGAFGVHWLLADEGASSASGAMAMKMSGDEHVAMGSGVAVALTSEGPTASRTKLAAGTTTLILRSELDSATTLDIEPVDGTNGPTMTSQTIKPGQRVEWPVALTPGSYELCVLVDGTPTMGSTLTVS